MAAALILNYICGIYFEVGRANIVYSLCFFIVGGLNYLYRDKIEQLNCCITIPMMVLCVAIYYLVGGNTITQILVAASMLIFALGRGGILQNKFTSFISGISMEIYLSHMVIFRVIEKLRFNKLFENDMLQYIVTLILVLIGTVLFSITIKKILGYLAQSLFPNRGVL